MTFLVQAKDQRTMARTGELTTTHGIVQTPVFMPVGTKGAVKTMTPALLRDLGCTILLSNTYHLALRPGEEILREFHGLHHFMAWDGPILTDSGGYQVFSLAKLAGVSEEGVRFHSHIDGSAVTFTPESVIRFQRVIDSDIIMPLDQPIPSPCTKDAAAEAMGRTHRWLKRSLEEPRGEHQLLFGIIQGSVFDDLRAESAQFVRECGLPGFALGGFRLGEDSATMDRSLRAALLPLPEEKPRYLMGVGTPSDIIRSVAAGVDMFDCILPTRLGRNGCAYTGEGIVKIRNNRHRLAHEPLGKNCACYCCRTFSRAYLRHLFVTEEILGPAMLSLHNIHFYLTLMADIRAAIASGTYEAFMRERLKEALKER